MSEAISYTAPTYPSNASSAFDIGFRLDYRAPKQAKELFAEVPESQVIVDTAVGVTEKYSTLILLDELLNLLRGEQPQFRNIEEVLGYVVGIGNIGSDDMISVFDVVGSGFCVASDDGYRLYNSIRAALLQGKKACISFRNITNLSAAFLDAALGQLCNGEFSFEEISNRISLIEISSEKMFLVECTINDAKGFFSDPRRLKIAMDSIATEGEID
ncbi:MAG TPA: STAS-like domain-containing protein [Methanothrix sp.]|nr:STAS-like domain-containing protein [Methanothrix sp.]